MEPIPSKDRKEWEDLIRGAINVPLSNFVLQMKVTQARQKVAKGEMPLSQAVDEIHQLCNKYSLAVRADIHLIFHPGNK